MTAALVEARGRSTGCYLSPHSERWSQRVRVRGAEIDARAVRRCRGAGRHRAPRRRAGLRGGRADHAVRGRDRDRVRRARRGRGGGGRDRGGPRRAARRDQRAALAGDGADLDRSRPHRLARRDRARDRGREARGAARGLDARAGRGIGARGRTGAPRRRPSGGATSSWRRRRPEDAELAAPYLRRNLGVALAAAEVVAGPVEPEELRRALGSLDLAGRFELVAGEPPLVLDAAHNPDGARALAEALAERLGDRPVVACLAILADKDAGGIVAALAPALAAAVCTEIPVARLEGSGRPGTSAVPAAELVRLCEAASVPATAHAEPAGRGGACDRDGPRARRGGADRRLALPSAVRMDRDARSELLQMMGLVAAVVAVVILVFFGLGYLFGRLFCDLRLRVDSPTSMPLLAIFGIENDGINLAINLLILFLVVVYLALIAYTYLDAKRRLEDPVLIGCATVASLFPFLGHDRLHDPPPAGVPRGPARARARDPRGAAARAPARGLVVPELRAPGRPHRTCAARAAARGSRTRARRAASRSIRAGASAHTARRPPVPPPPRRSAARRAHRPRAAAKKPRAAASRPPRAKRPVSRTSEQRAAKQRAKPVRRSTTRSRRRSEPGEGTAPAS